MNDNKPIYTDLYNKQPTYVKNPFVRKTMKNAKAVIYKKPIILFVVLIALLGIPAYNILLNQFGDEGVLIFTFLAPFLAIPIYIYCRYVFSSNLYHWLKGEFSKNIEYRKDFIYEIERRYLNSRYLLSKKYLVKAQNLFALEKQKPDSPVSASMQLQERNLGFGYQFSISFLPAGFFSAIQSSVEVLEKSGEKLVISKEGILCEERLYKFENIKGEEIITRFIRRNNYQYLLVFQEFSEIIEIDISYSSEKKETIATALWYYRRLSQKGSLLSHNKETVIPLEMKKADISSLKPLLYGILVAATIAYLIWTFGFKSETTQDQKLDIIYSQAETLKEFAEPITKILDESAERYAKKKDVVGNIKSIISTLEN